MSPPFGGIDPHQDTFTVGIVDGHGVEIAVETFANTAAGYGEAIDSLAACGVEQVGVEGSAKWVAHEYFVADPDILWDTITHDVPALAALQRPH